MVNDTARIRKNPKMVAINSAIEVDATGQVCADSIGPNMFSFVFKAFPQQKINLKLSTFLVKQFILAQLAFQKNR